LIRTVFSPLVLAAAVAYGFGIWLFPLHNQDRLPAHADAIVVLAGSQARLPVALQLADAHVAKTLVVSVDDATKDPDRYALCHGAKPKRFTLLCRAAVPYSTRGEARLIAELVRRHHWQTIVVVTSRYHLYRARILIQRCTNVDLSMRAADGDSWWAKAIAIPLEYVKLARADTLQRGC
jgi:uncharacterized SAM-binding protein YcdF (DUF218 family)